MGAPSPRLQRSPLPNMAVGKNKRLSKGKKGIKKRVVDPFTRKDWYDLKAPSMFDTRNVGKTLVNRSPGLKNANDSLKGRIFELSLADLNKDDENSFRKVSLRVDEVQGKVPDQLQRHGLHLGQAPLARPQVADPDRGAHRRQDHRRLPRPPLHHRLHQASPEPGREDDLRSVGADP